MPISTLATISLPLDVPQVEVLATKQTRDNKFIITVESLRETTQCGICKKEIACTYGHGQAVRLRHLPILGQETYIVIRPRRAQCPTCQHKPTTTQTLKWYDQRSPHTKAYDRYLMKLLIGSTVADVSLKETWGTMLSSALMCCQPHEISKSQKVFVNPILVDTDDSQITNT